MEIRTLALTVLCLRDPADKVAATEALYAQLLAGQQLDEQLQIARPDGVPGRPDRPRLMSALQVPKRPAFTLEGRARCCMRSRTSSSMRSISH
jgi:uncharacterized ferritin-like protein (DUF455 family)